MKFLIFNFNNYYFMSLLFLILSMLMIPLKFNKIHPLNFIIMLIFITFIVATLINLTIKSWLNFILILIIIGSLMIIFMYITSISNNNLFMINYKNILIIMIKILITIIILMKMMNFININFLINYQDNWNLNFNMIENNDEMLMSKMFNLNKPSTIYIMFYLYFTMLCIMNICLMINAPLRQLYYN